MSRKKTMGIFAFVAIAALLTLGVGYASWTDHLSVGGNVVTGSFNETWANVTNSSSGDSATDPITCGITADSAHKTLTIAISNMYPGTACHFAGDIQNTGTLPVQATGTFTGPSSTVAGLTFTPNCVSTAQVIDAMGAVHCTLDVALASSADNTSMGKTVTGSYSVDFAVAP